MRLFSYVIVRDYGFAPNPFNGYCTLCTCKPTIRRDAKVGDWVLGTGSKTIGRDQHAVFVMRVTEAMSFDDYWNDSRFAFKRPNLHGSKKQAFGDNIYHQCDGAWAQLNSHHSYAGGAPNQRNIENDTKHDRILISEDFAYWGGNGPEIPSYLREFGKLDIYAGRGHHCNFSSELVESFAAWFNALPDRGYLGKPLHWARTP